MEEHYKANSATWNKVAHLYQGKFMDMSLYDDSYDLFCKLIEKQNANLLEVGCGPGNITRYLLNKRADFKILATDVAPNMLVLAKENNPAADFKEMDCRDISKIGKTFDAIICGFCMPYLSKEDAILFICDASDLLVKGGILYFSAIEDDYSKSTFETSSNGEHTMFVYYHEAEYLQKTLTNNSFETIEIFRKGYKKNDGSDQTHIIFAARKN